MSSAWFRPKRYGYGVSPATWQGWALTGGFVATAVATPPLVRTLTGGGPGTPLWTGLTLAALTGGFIALAIWRSEGTWRWRWGERE